MTFQELLNGYILPTVGIILASAMAYGLKVLIAWLKEQQEKTKDERKKFWIGVAIGIAEEIDHKGVKLGNGKMKPDDKEKIFRTKITEIAKDKKMVLTDAEIDNLLKGTLGMTRG